ncbi:MAG: cyclase family protein [Acidimicrobiia bacterium]
MVYVPDGEEVLGYLDGLSNRGRWGADDQRGTLNLITPEVRRAATALVVEGISVSCSQEVVGSHQEESLFGAPQRLVLLSHKGRFGAGSMEAFGAYIGLVYHGPTVTHLDSLCHYSFDGEFYNGTTTDHVDFVEGATSHAVTNASDGVLTRGVLLDIASLMGVDSLEPGTAVLPEHLDAAETRQGVEVGQGAALLIYTGYVRYKREVGPTSMERGYAGFHAACLPWFHERGVAIVGSDTGNDVVPSGYEFQLPVHVVALSRMGLWLLDACDLEGLVETCRRLDRADFLLTMNPLRLAGGTGSPVNPVATF